MSERDRISLDSPRVDAWLVYDGECPFCSAYASYLRVRESVGVLHLIDARDGGSLVEEIRSTGFDLNDGMVLKLGGRLYCGTDCIHALALLSSRSSFFNRLNARVFRSHRLAQILYPVLRAGRNFTLRLLGRTKIPEHPIRDVS